MFSQFVHKAKCLQFMKRNGSFSEKDLCTFHTQVSLSEYLMEDYKAVDTLKSLATFPQNLSKIIAKEKGGLMAVGSNGIWICPGCKHVLHVCRGGITGTETLNIKH